MISRLSSKLSASRRSEQGGDAVWTILFVIPFMLILTFALVDIGTMFAARYAVTNVLRDTVRMVSAYGGDGPFAFQPYGTESFSTQATNLLKSGIAGADGTKRCKFGPCTNTDFEVVCGKYDANGNFIGGNASNVGDWVGCEIRTDDGTNLYPYKGVTGGLLNTELAAGFGNIVKPFPVKVLGRSETGDNPTID